MKKLTTLLLASIIVGFATFALMYWLFKISYDASISSAIAVGVTGLLIEYIKPLFIKKNGETKV